MSSKKLLINATMIFGVVLAGYLLYRVFKGYSLDEIVTSMSAIPLGRIAASFGFAALSYLSLVGFDWLGLRYAGKPLSLRRAALASFTGLSIGHNLGVAALSSGAVRYRFYSRWGLNAEEVAKVILFCGVTVGLGLSALAGVALLLNPGDAANGVKLDRNSIFLLGLACLAIPVIYILLSAVLRAPLKVWKWHFKLPGFKLAVAQVAVGTLNFVFVAACLHELLVAGGEVSFVKTATAFVLANIAILMTHVPGGLGVLEATVTHVLPGAASLGALIAFRVIYFLVPLFIGVPLFFICELLLKRKGSASRAEAERQEEPAGQPVTG